MNKAYSVNHGDNISVVVPDVARYVAGSCKGSDKWIMYHTQIIDNNIRLTNEDNKQYAVLTANCDCWDNMGFCKGHRMTLQEFLDMFCNGILPDLF